jgi:hypothetical protein
MMLSFRWHVRPVTIYPIHKYMYSEYILYRYAGPLRSARETKESIRCTVRANDDLRETWKDTERIKLRSMPEPSTRHNLIFQRINLIDCSSWESFGQVERCRCTLLSPAVTTQQSLVSRSVKNWRTSFNDKFGESSNRQPNCTSKAYSVVVTTRKETTTKHKSLHSLNILRPLIGCWKTNF